MEQTIVDYILEAEKHGISEYEIKQNLLDAGWDAELVEKSFVFAKMQNFKNLEAEKQESVNVASANFSNSMQILDIDKVQSKSFILKRIFKIKKFIFFTVVTSLILILAILGYYIINTNPKLFALEFINKLSSTTHNIKFNITYSSNSASNTKTSFNMQFLGIATENPKFFQSSSDGKFSVSSNDLSFSNDFKHIRTEDDLYFQVGSNPILNLLSSELNSGNKIEWFKINLNKLQENLNLKFKDELTLNNVLKNVSVKKFIGFERIDGKLTAHFVNDIDKQELIKLVLENAELKNKGPNSELISSLLIKLLEKSEIKQFDTWISLTDFNLIQTNFEVSAPILNSNLTTSMLYNESDVKRIQDAAQIQTALNNYYSKYKGYPDGIMGSPLKLAPEFISEFPKAPSPASGNCTDYFNGYWYKPAGERKIINNNITYSSYQITYCLGYDLLDYQAGIGKLTPNGILSNIECPVDLVLCRKEINKEELNTWVEKIVSNIDFTANIKFNLSYSNFGTSAEINSPTNSIDIFDATNLAMEKAYNAKVLAEIRQITLGLETYLNYSGKYPNSLNDLVPKYLSSIPKPLSSVNTSLCSNNPSNYEYEQVGSKKYKLKFCLTKETGGYKEGNRVATDTGIE